MSSALLVAFSMAVMRAPCSEAVLSRQRGRPRRATYIGKIVSSSSLLLGS